MGCYADSSFLVSCYATDINTPLAKAWLSRISPSLAFTALHALEVRNAFKLGAFRGLLNAAQAAAAWTNVEGDLRGGRLVKTTVRWPVAFRLAARMAEDHSMVIGTRSLDILHVGAARVLRAVTFVSFDSRQRALAAAVGMTVAP